MTDPVRAKLSERMQNTASWADDGDAQVSAEQLLAWATEVSALEARLAAAEGVAEEWRKDATEWAGCEECTGAERTLKDCADELSAILKGEGKLASSPSSGDSS